MTNDRFLSVYRDAKTNSMHSYASLAFGCRRKYNILSRLLYLNRYRVLAHLKGLDSLIIEMQLQSLLFLIQLLGRITNHANSGRNCVSIATAAEPDASTFMGLTVGQRNNENKI